jgi:hypothetical protein
MTMTSMNSADGPEPGGPVAFSCPMPNCGLGFEAVPFEAGNADCPSCGATCEPGDDDVGEADATFTVPKGGDGDPDGMNNQRVGWAWAAVADFAGRTGLDIRPDADGMDTAMSDLLANMMHLAREEGLDMATLLRRAATHFEAETLADDEAEAA